MRAIDYNASRKAAVVSGIVTFTQSDIGASAGLIRLIATIHGSGNGRYFGSGGVERAVVKANGTPIVNLNYKQLAALNSRLSLSNVNPLFGEELSSATAGLGDFYSRNQSITIPLHFADLEDERKADMCQFPPAATITVEFWCGSTITTSATIQLSWMTTQEDPRCYPMFLDNFLNFSASGNTQQFALTQPGIFRGLIVPRLGVARLKLTVGGKQILHTTGFNATASTNPTYQDEGDALAETQAFENAPQPFVTVEGTNDLVTVNVKNHLCIVNDTGLGMSLGASKIEMDTGSAWATATPDNSCAVLSYVPIRQS